MREIDVAGLKDADTAHAVEIGDRVWWVGHYQPNDMFQCHAYLIEHGGSSVLIDPGGHLTFEHVRKKVEEVVPFSSIRYFVCHHQDPDITASLKTIDSMAGLHPDAVVVTHWRARELIKHYDLKMPFWEIEEHGWQLDLGGRLLFFIFTPYLHFPGAFCTFDPASEILFSSDLFGGMTSEWSFVARDESYFDDIRLFHEHYMPSREILLHSLLKIEEYPVRTIAPQHGSIITGALVGFLIRKLKQLDCGVFALAGDRTDIRRLSLLNKTLKDITNTVIIYRDFREIAEALRDILKRTIPVASLEFYAKAGAGDPLYFEPETRYRGLVEKPPDEVREILCADFKEWNGAGGAAYRKAALRATPARLRGNAKDWCLLIPLFSGQGPGAAAAAVVRLSYDIRPTDELDQMLRQISRTLGAAMERETFYHMLDTERRKFYEQSIRDPLTGLYSRFYMEETIERLMHVHDRNERYTISMAMFDLDDFKRINDLYGHGAGDEVIRRAATIIRGFTRAGDIAVRYGGDEFAVFLMGHTASECVIVAEKIRGKIREMEFDGAMKGCVVTCSAGVSERRQRESFADFLRRSDEALYSAKSSGRDRTECLGCPGHGAGGVDARGG